MTRASAVIASICIAACASRDPPSPGEARPGTPRTARTDTATTAHAELSAGWNEIRPGGDTLCARGEAYSFWVRPGRSERVVIDFAGGGACWDERTCSVAGSTFSDSVAPLRGVIERGGLGGIHAARSDNPFADDWHVVVPYCTGDIHWGDATRRYGDGRDAVTIHHRGARNSRAVLEWVFARFEAPERVMVTGCSAGAYGAALWSAHVMRRYPSARVVQLGDSGAGVITEDFFEHSFPGWNAEPAFPSWIEALDPARTPVRELTFGDLYVAIASAYPQQRMSQFDTLRDAEQVAFFERMGGASAAAWSEQMQASIADIEARAPSFASYLAPGAQHCVIPGSDFYAREVDGTRFVDWVRELASGADVESVRP